MGSTTFNVMQYKKHYELAPARQEINNLWILFWAAQRKKKSTLSCENKCLQ